MRLIYFMFLFFLFPAGVIFSQSYFIDYSQKERGDGGNLNINHDERLDELVRRHIAINKEKKGIEGYRIRIFSESGQGARDRANNERANFFNKYPDIETYLVYDAPNFKVYIGDFRTKSEALKMQKEINKDYPYSFIISDRINFPSLE